ncbi:MAG: relaxase domain-containing protein [Mycobacteriaceae bacterium]|nr:relaxase domain-containing protein [Mycobacteriaceae bacterium]
MTATLYKLSAGDGYEYYVKHIAAHDRSERGHSSLADYYSAKGEAPGVWMGSGLVAFEDIAAGEVVSEAQMKALFGEGRHPNSDVIEAAVLAEEIMKGAKPKDAQRAALKAGELGSPFRIYTEATAFRQRCAQEFVRFNTAHGRSWDAQVPDQDRAQIRSGIATGMFTEEVGRGPLNEGELSGWVARNSRQRTTAVAGFDVTFSPVKSVSTLWAVAPRPVVDAIEAAHHRAIADALTYLESVAAYTRLGRNGVRQVDTMGVIATAFTHRDSRAGDPDLHTHVVVSNKVRTLDGRWAALDGRMLYRAMVSISEVYNTRLEMHLTEALGVEFAEREDSDSGKRAIREIIGVDSRLNDRWSTRDKQITARVGELATRFQACRGREPLPVEMYALMQQATLDTRAAKHDPRSHAEQRSAWRRQALLVLDDAAALTAMVQATLHPDTVVRPQVTPGWVESIADAVIERVSRDRAVWQCTHVRAEVERVVRGKVSAARWSETVGAVVTAALAPSRSIARRDPDVFTEPAVLRRRDTSSVYTTAGATDYTSAEILRAETRLVEAARRTGVRTVSASALGVALAEYYANHRRRLNAGQEALVREFATSGRALQLAIAPAGTGKSTSMQVLSRAWSLDGGTVLGLAPTAAAAATLGEEIHAPVATLDLLIHAVTTRPDQLPAWVAGIGTDTLAIIDEAAYAGTRQLDTAVAFLHGRGAAVRGIGDDKQLSAVAAGGVVRDIVRAAGAVALTEVLRFSDPAEGAAGLAMREGDPAALGYYLDHDRIHIGAPDTVADAAYTAWADDVAAGKDAIMLAPTHDIVDALNARGRADRLARDASLPGREVVLADGLRAGVGDLICTRRNNRRLPVARTDYVRNGYRWRVTRIHGDGRVEAVRVRPNTKQGRRVVLPVDYVGKHVTLGYATTIDSAQGITVDVCHGVLAGVETRNQLYVMLTRGRHGNHLYLATAPDAGEQALWTDRALHPPTWVDVLREILARDGAATSATTNSRDAFDPRQRLSRVVDAYTDALGVLAEHHLGPERLVCIDTDAETRLPGLTEAPAWPVLRAHLAILAVEGRDPTEALDTAIAARGLGDAADVAAVLDWRLDHSGGHSAGVGPLPWLPGIPTALQHHPEFGNYLEAQALRITELAEQVTTLCRTWTPATAPPWAQSFLGDNPDLLSNLAVWRAALAIDDHDQRATGPARYPVVEHRHQIGLDECVSTVLEGPGTASTRWAPLARKIEPRLLNDPFWLELADRIDTAHQAGVDTTAVLTGAAALRPLPVDMPAAALWWRIATGLEPATTVVPGPAVPPRVGLGTRGTARQATGATGYGQRGMAETGRGSRRRRPRYLDAGNTADYRGRAAHRRSCARAGRIAGGPDRHRTGVEGRGDHSPHRRPQRTPANRTGRRHQPSRRDRIEHYGHLRLDW